MPTELELSDPKWRRDPKDKLDPGMSPSEQRAWRERNSPVRTPSMNGTDNDGNDIPFIRLGGSGR